MFNNPELMELIIIAAIAAGLIYKFFYTLGEKTGFEKPAEADPRFSTEEKAADESEEEFIAAAQTVPEQFQEILKNIKQIDSRFSLKPFMDGAVMAFEMVLQAYATGDRNLLKNLLSDALFVEFDATISARERKGHTLSTTLVKLAPPEIENIVLRGTVANITLKYTSEQTNILYGPKRQILEGSPNQIEDVVDVWTFQRDLRSSNPNWTLVETGA
jgi:predicted lipid-binding transport protein (Tim44 family)